MTKTLADLIEDALPQTQCTKCGYPACRPYAEAIAAGEAEINQCPPGGHEGIERLSAITGRKVIPLNPVNGFERPRPVAFIDESLCIGCTLCIQACPVDAILGAAKQMHTILPSLCTGCDLCVAPCPVDCIVMFPVTGDAAGWDAWTQDQADAARARHDFRTARLERERRENDARLAAKAVAKMKEVTAETGNTEAEIAEKERKRAIIAAAIERARQKASQRMNPAKRLEIFTRFRAANPHPTTELEYSTPFELLIAVLLSAQSTDVGVNKATRKLYPVANTPAAMLALGLDELKTYISSIGLYNTKAKNVIGHLPDPGRPVRRRSAALARGAGVSARGGPQDGERGVEYRLWRSDHCRRHPHLPGLEPDQAGARQDGRDRRAEITQIRAEGIFARCASLADFAREIYLHCAEAAVLELHYSGFVRVQAEDGCAGRGVEP